MWALDKQANKYGYVLFACDWWGMSGDDVVPLLIMVANDLSNFRILPDRLHQGMLNALSLTRLMKVRVSLSVCSFFPCF